MCGRRKQTETWSKQRSLSHHHECEGLGRALVGKNLRARRIVTQGLSRAAANYLRTKPQLVCGKCCIGRLRVPDRQFSCYPSRFRSGELATSIPEAWESTLPSSGGSTCGNCFCSFPFCCWACHGPSLRTAPVHLHRPRQLALHKAQIQARGKHRVQAPVVK